MLSRNARASRLESPHNDRECLARGVMLLRQLVCCIVLFAWQHAFAQPGEFIEIAIDAEFGVPNSTSAQAVRNGAGIAVHEINANGGVLGRKLTIVERDNRAVPARSLNNLRELAADPDVVAVMCGRYSPVVVEILPEIHRLGMILLDPWAAADSITEHSFSPSYVFRVSLSDSLALQVMMRYGQKIGARKIGLLLSNTELGRSSLKAAESTASRFTRQEIVAIQWYNWGDASLIAQYHTLRKAGAEAVVFIANDREAIILVKELAAVPAEQRLPIISHWGTTGGRFVDLAGPAREAVDLAVVQTYSFIGKSDPIAKRVLLGLQQLTGSDDPRKVASPVGVAQAYDLVHLLALAIKRAGTTDRAAVRTALEGIGPYRGLVRRYERPFTAARHDALTIDDVFMARYAKDGAIEPISRSRR